MFNSRSAIILMVFPFFLFGCATTPSSFWYTSTEQLIASHQYQKAITQLTKERPNDQISLLKVKALAEKQQKKQTYEINKLINNKKWGEARAVLKQLSNNQPKLAALGTLELRIDRAQHEEERLINTQRALLEAELLSLQFIQQDLTDRIYFNRINWFSINEDLMAKKHKLAEELLSLSTQALLIKDYSNAQKSYEKAIELDKKLGAREITDAINTGLSRQNNKAINERQNSLIRQLYLAIDKKDFEYILKIQDILSNKIFNGAEVQRAISKAKNIRLEYSKKLDTSASKEYRKGNISTAIVQWQQALILTSEEINIQEKLIRAKKVQRKLEKLTNSE